MIKNIKFLKLSFYKNTSTEGGALKEAIKQTQKTKRNYHPQSNHKKWQMLNINHSRKPFKNTTQK